MYVYRCTHSRHNMRHRFPPQRQCGVRHWLHHVRHLRLRQYPRQDRDRQGGVARRGAPRAPRRGGGNGSRWGARGADDCATPGGAPCGTYYNGTSTAGSPGTGSGRVARGSARGVGRAHAGTGWSASDAWGAGRAPHGGAHGGGVGGECGAGAAETGPRDISELLAQALDAYRRDAAGGEGAAQAAPGSEADVGELIAQALAAVTPRTEEATEEPSEEAHSGGRGTGRGVQETQAQAMGSGVMEPSGERAKVEGVEDWMWEWREWRQVVPGEPCPAGLVYSMDLHASTSCARLPDNLRARLDAAEAAKGEGADERPLAPFLPRPDTPPAVIVAGDKAEEEQEAEGDEEAYGPGESALDLMYEDDAGPDVYASMDVDPANAPLLPMPTAAPPPPLGSFEQRHCRFHAAEGAQRHRLVGTGQREAGMLASALERYELQRPGQVAREVDLVAGSPDDGQVRCVQLGDAAVLGHHPGDVRAAEPQEGIPLSVRLSVRRMLGEAGLEDVRRDDGLYVALWRGGADAWRREQAVRPPHAPCAGVPCAPGGAAPRGRGGRVRHRPPAARR